MLATHPVGLLDLIFERFDISRIDSHTFVVRPIERQNCFVFLAAIVESLYLASVTAALDVHAHTLMPKPPKD